MDGTPLKARHTLSPEIARLVAEHRPGGPLERDFYVAPEVFEADLARIFHRHWIFAGYAFQVARPGDFFTYKVGTESVIVVRDRAGEIRAFHNVCRHRGSRICKTEQGNAHRLVCPYHRWTYELDGALVLDTSKEFGVDRAGLLAAARRHRECGRPAVHLARRRRRPTSRRRSPPSGTR